MYSGDEFAGLVMRILVGIFCAGVILGFLASQLL